MSSPRLRWENAEVHDGELTVSIVGELPDGWADKFSQTVTLLDTGRWDKIRCKGDKIRVKGVSEGDEESLHHFLESAVQEANAAFDADDDGRPDEDDEGDDAEARDDPDARLTERFREFGTPDDAP